MISSASQASRRIFLSGSVLQRCQTPRQLLLPNTPPPPSITTTTTTTMMMVRRVSSSCPLQNDSFLNHSRFLQQSPPPQVQPHANYDNSATSVRMNHSCLGLPLQSRQLSTSAAVVTREDTTTIITTTTSTTTTTPSRRRKLETKDPIVVVSAIQFNSVLLYSLCDGHDCHYGDYETITMMMMMTMMTTRTKLLKSTLPQAIPLCLFSMMGGVDRNWVVFGS
jgi:hypothetical protein